MNRTPDQLLAWAIEFVSEETLTLAECHFCPRSGTIEPETVERHVDEARAWLDEARELLTKIRVIDAKLVKVKK